MVSFLVVEALLPHLMLPATLTLAGGSGSPGADLWEDWRVWEHPAHKWFGETVLITIPRAVVKLLIEILTGQNT